jgi:hypothetical protein
VITPVADPATDYWMPDNVDIRSAFLEVPDGNFVQLDVRTELADRSAADVVVSKQRASARTRK